MGRNTDRPIENRYGVDFDNYRYYLMSVIGSRDECIIAAENRGVNIYDWYPDPHHDRAWNLIGTLPSESSLNAWLDNRDFANGEISTEPGTLIIFWELHPRTGEIVIKPATTKNTAWHNETNQ
jgi:hypothetical protein